MINRRTTSLLVAFAVASGSALAQDVIREGGGSRRDTLNSMEQQPVPSWDTLKDWQGEPLTPESAAGNVVLFVTWASWYPNSHKGLSTAQRLNEKYAKDGLIVVGVHTDDGWDGASSIANRQKVDFAYARDADNAFRDTWLVDQDPDFYLVDRAGQLRFADIDTRSVEQATKELLGESSDDAATLLDRLRERRQQMQIQQSRAQSIRSGVGMSDLPPVPPGYTQPPETQYQLADWPAQPVDPNERRRSSSRDGHSGPRPLDISKEGLYPAGQAELEGRIRIVYFWDHRVRETWDGVLTQMDKVQRRGGRDVIVIGARANLFEVDNRRRNNDDEEEDLDLSQTQKLLQKFIVEQKLNHFFAPNTGMITMPGDDRNRRRNDRVQPQVAIVSSDGLLRWFGNLNHPNFESAVYKVLRVDPGVQLRRRLDDQFLSTSGG